MIDPAVARAVANAIQWVVLACSVGILAVSVVIAHYWKLTRPYLILPITLAIHSIIFYAFALSDVLVSPWGNLWSAALRLHSYIMILGVLIVVGLSLAGKEDEAAE